MLILLYSPIPYSTGSPSSEISSTGNGQRMARPTRLTLAHSVSQTLTAHTSIRTAPPCARSTILPISIDRYS
jgi:hypothetical protein